MITEQIATEMVRRHVDAGLSVREIRPLTGGMVNTVVELVTDGEPGSIVAKISDNADSKGFQWEYESLRYYLGHTAFPVPRPYACFQECGGFRGSCLLMEKVGGRHLGRARLTAAGTRHFQQELARRLAALHDHRRDTYGSALKEGRQSRWLDTFAAGMEKEFEAVRDQLAPRSGSIVAGLLANLSDWLPEFHQPTLIHGDLWATNILVDDRDPDRPRITAFLDGGANFGEVESELAYLRVFSTAGATFFEHYAGRHPLREGFDRRCRVYWLNTMLLHLRVFGREYLPACRRLADEIESLS